jgi:hypothetical protein
MFPQPLLSIASVNSNLIGPGVFLFMTVNRLQTTCIYSDQMLLFVIFHLVEFVLFEKYLEDLFSSALNLVVIYGADLDYIPETEHELYRKFTAYIENKFPEWKLEKVIKNRYPSKNYKDQSGSLSDLFFYTKK